MASCTRVILNKFGENIDLDIEAKELDRNETNSAGASEIKMVQVSFETKGVPKSTGTRRPNPKT